MVVKEQVCIPATGVVMQFPYSSFMPLFVSWFLCLGSVGYGQSEGRGVVLKSAEASPGYTLIAPFGGQETFLIDLNGSVVHSWKTERKPSQAAYLLEDGSLVRTAKIPNPNFNVRGGPAGGVQRFSWEGELLWDYTISDEFRLSHHDIEPLPNGNVLVVAWERKTRAQAIEAGRDPERLEGDEIWPEVVLEIKPRGKTEGDIVWEWHVWDHLVQSFDATKKNYGKPDEHPELIDINYMDRPIADWIHMNSVDYNPDFDQILLCGRTFDEIWVIDHGTTTDQARGSTEGRCKAGGDLLYRWGNPFAYFAGTPFDQVLYGQHDPHWIPPGLPGAGNILIFNNGSDRDQRAFSTVDELSPPVEKDGSYSCAPDSAFGPQKLVWTYKDPDKLYSQRVSGAQRLPNGNTLICSGETGLVFEVTKDGRTVWEYLNFLGASSDPTSKSSGTSANTPAPLQGVAMFRAHRYPPDYPAFRNRSLRPQSN